MKKSFFLCMVFLAGSSVFAQVFVDRIYYVNPGKNDVFFRTDTIYAERNMDPGATSELFRVEYSIYDSTKTLIYRYGVDNYHIPGGELFITEQSVFYISIPPFEWHGEISNKDYEQIQIRETGKSTAPEDEYTLIISLKTGRKTEPLLFPYKIIVDETPPVFEPHFIQNPQDGKYYIYTDGEMADQWKYVVRKKDADIDSKPYTHEDRLGVFSFIPEEDGEYEVIITAIDEAKNESTKPLRLSAKINTLASSEDRNQETPSESGRTTGSVIPRSDARNNSQRYGRLSDIPLMSDGYLAFPDITFHAYPISGLVMADTNESMKNITDIVNTLKPFMDEIKVIHIHGYANPLTRGSSAKIQREEEDEVLQPLSFRRAEYVKNLFVLMGIPEEKIQVTGMGGKKTWANSLDNEVNWKNRTVKICFERID